eukprot:4380671-Pyramimonas_sp.AAC.1
MLFRHHRGHLALGTSESCLRRLSGDARPELQALVCQPEDAAVSELDLAPFQQRRQVEERLGGRLRGQRLVLQAADRLHVGLLALLELA